MTPRDASTARAKRRIRAGILAGLAVVVVAGLWEASLTFGVTMPVWTVPLAPLAYAALAPAFLRRVSLIRRIVWALLAWSAQLALGVVTAAVLTVIGDLDFFGAWERMLWSFAPAPILHFVAAPFVLLPFRERLLPRGPARAGYVPAHAKPASVPIPVFAPRPINVGAENPFARREAAHEAAVEMAGEAAAPPTAVAPPEALPLSSSPSTALADDEIVRIPFERMAGQIPADMFVLPVDRIAASLREPGMLVVPRRLVIPQLQEGAVEIAWIDVDTQFPELAFAMPPHEVRAKFPGWKLTLPLDEIVRQLPPEMFRTEGPPHEAPGIEVFPPPFQPFSSVAPDSVVPPAPTPVVSPAPPSVAPPTPLAVATASPSATTAPHPVATAPPLAVPDVPAPVSDPLSIDAENLGERIAAEWVAMTAAPPVQESDVTEAAPVATAPATEPSGVTPPQAPAVAVAPVAGLPASVAEPEVDEVAAAVVADFEPSRAVAPPVVGSPSPPQPEVMTRVMVEDEDMSQARAWAREKSVEFAPVGAVEVDVRRGNGGIVVSLVGAGIDVEAVASAGASLAPFVGPAGPIPCEQLTVRAARAAVVVTTASGATLAVAVRRGGAVALAEILARRIAEGDVPGAIGATTSARRTLSRALAPAAINGSVSTIGNVLDGFGRVAPARFATEGGELSVYVFRPREVPAQPFGDIAAALWEALADADAPAALGPIESIVLREGRRHSVVRPFAAARGPVLLVASGTVDHAGLALRQAARAAAQLEAV
jgi:hypothetical protein